MNENVPFVWRKNYYDKSEWHVQLLEIAHEKARQYLNRAVKINEPRQRKR